MKSHDKSKLASDAFGKLNYQNETLWGRPGFLARRLHQIHVAIFLETFADLGVTPIQWGVMTVVRSQPGLGYGEIASAVGIDPSNASDDPEGADFDEAKRATRTDVPNPVAQPAQFRGT
jgi:hypothetical protein